MNIAKLYLVLVIVLFVLGVYYPILSAPFNSVDDVNMINSLLNQESVNLWQLFVPRSGGAYYRPLLYLTFIFDGFLWGLQASFMHLENILLHALNAVLVFFIAEQLFSSLKITSRLPALTAALLFALHPINTEAVNWISGRTDVMAGTFLLFSLYLLLKSLKSNGKVLTGCAAGLCFFLACLCKDSAVFALPGFLWMIAVWGMITGKHDSKEFFEAIRHNVYSLTAFSIASVGYFVLRHQALSAGDSGVTKVVSVVSGKETDFFNTIRILFKVFGFYLKKLVIPWPLNFTIVQVADYNVFIGIIVLVLIGFTMWRSRIIGACLFFSCCIIAPALLVPLGKFAWTPVAERYLYMATPTFCLATVIAFYLAYNHFKQARAIPLAAGLAFFALIFSVSARNLVWQSNLTLYEDSVKKSPDFMPARNELALALLEAGRVDQAQKIIMSNYLPNDNKFSVVTNLSKATVLINKKKFREAKALLSAANYTQSSPLYSQYVETIIRINENLLAEPQTSKAEVQSLNNEIIQSLLKLHNATSDPFYYYRIGQRHLKADNIEEAKRYFDLAYNQAPANAHYRIAAGRLYERLNK